MGNRAQEHDANKGLNIKVFLTAVIVGIVVILVFFFVFLAARGKKNIPKANQPNPNSRLVLPVSPGILG